MTKILLLLSGIMLLGGCAGVSRKKADTPPPTPDFAPLVSSTQLSSSASAAEKFANALAEAIRKKSFQPWAQQLPPGRKITEPMFLQMCSSFNHQYGTFDSMNKLGELDQGIVRDYLWKMRFLKPGAPPAKPTPHEIIFWVRIYQEKGKAPAVGGFGFKQF